MDHRISGKNEHEEVLENNRCSCSNMYDCSTLHNCIRRRKDILKVL